jgi:hypothetical protein
MVANVVFRKWKNPNQGIIALFPDANLDVLRQLRACGSARFSRFHGIHHQRARVGCNSELNKRYRLTIQRVSSTKAISRLSFVRLK